MSPEENTLTRIKELVAKHALCPVETLSAKTRLGEDLKIVGDDADEFLEEFARSFNVDMSGMVFNDYFPDEATADMHYYLTAIARSSDHSGLLKSAKLLESRIWGMFAKRTLFKTLTIEDLLLAVQRGQWI
jgi:hypothetical protein